MILFLDTSERCKKVICLLDENGVVERVTSQGDLLSSLEKLLKKHRLSFEALKEIRVNLGPGSFTSLRIGCAVANALNYALGLKEADSWLAPRYDAAEGFRLKN